ncbi:MAG: ATP-binding protein [Candidatus Fermentibacteraceae bacterium]|nr:ATP-binding protein [Candidatus Fermentibacteraceae bacterium]MBN2609308.1 ATP-binding protein [Candidatus Fermentibacteraceae bacterium]
MPNPFSYGGIVRGGDFCNRRKEIEDLVRAGLNGEKLFIHGERRIGKTSLLRRAADELRSAGALTLMINVWKCVDASDLVDLCASEFAGAEGSRGLLKRVKSIFEGLSPAVAVGDDGRPSLTLARSSRGFSPEQLESVLRASWKIADSNSDRRLVVIFDEFQQIRKLGDDSIERVLRSVVQERDDIAWFFCGSRTHLIREMFLDSSSPLYRSAGHYPLESIDYENWFPFIEDKFSSTDRNVPGSVVELLLRITSGHPFYTQMLCSALWDMSESGRAVTEEMTEQALDVLLEREHSTYLILWDSLPEMSRRMLRAVAMDDPLRSPYSGEVLSRYGFKSPSSAGRAIEYLVAHDIIVRTAEGGYAVTDRFLGLWCRRNLLTVP